ncbi:MAG: hypothetical protein ACEQSA_06945, partial [Weeksellaceae bacterium]
ALIVICSMTDDDRARAFFRKYLPATLTRLPWRQTLAVKPRSKVGQLGDAIDQFGHLFAKEARDLGIS